MAYEATLNPVVYEGGILVSIDTEYNSWGMDPEVKLVVCAELNGFPGSVQQVKEICKKLDLDR